MAERDQDQDAFRSGLAGADTHVPGERGGSRHKTPASLRRRIAIWAVLIGLIAGAIDLPRPIEEWYRLLGSAAHARKSDGQTVIVTIDDRSLSEMDVRDPRRSDDARLLDTLFAAGARRVVFDRAFSETSTLSEDNQFIAALERHRGRVFIGSTPEVNSSIAVRQQLLTHPRFRGHAEMVSMTGREGPFGLSWKLPTSSFIEGRERRSISAVLANVDRPYTEFRPDFSIRISDVPLFSYAAVLKGRVAPSAFAGKDVIVAPANLTTPDRYRIPMIGAALGSQIHAIGAQTLREGIPTDLGWLPAFALACVFAAWQAKRRIASRWATLAAVGLFLVSQPVLGLLRIHVDIMPALLVTGIAAYRLHALVRATYRSGTRLLRLEHLRSTRLAGECDVVAIKIRNFATISAILSPVEIKHLLAKLEDMLRAVEAEAQFAFDKDTIVWLRDKIDPSERDDHLRGLHALFRSGISIGAQAPDVAIAIGLDTNYGAPMRERIEFAIQNAEDAAHVGKVFVIGEHESSDDRTWRMQFFTELDRAIEDGSMRVLFQPKIRLATGEIVGAEALLRWSHPVRGNIDPAMIIQYAEEHNRVDVVTRFVLDRALGEARKALARDPAFKVAVNISALDLRDPSFVALVSRFLARHAFPASGLILEITETAPIESDGVAAVIMADLLRMGVRLSVDDFGTGHASLHYLRQIPSYEVKIDRSFVSDMVESAEDYALVKTAIDMIHSLGRVAVAEGVETFEVAMALRDLGCDKAQGFYFSQAVPIEELIPKLSNGSLAA